MANNKNKISIIAGSLVLVAAVVACVVVLVVNNNKADDDKSPSPSPSGGTSTSVKSIQTVCQPAVSRDTCEEELSKAAGNATDIKSLIKVALEVPIKYLREEYNHSGLLAEAAKDPKNAGALEDCQASFENAIKDYESAVDSFMGYSLRDMANVAWDINTVVTSAVSNMHDCWDGLADDNKAAKPLKDALNKTLEIGRNAMAISAQIEKFTGDFNLSDMFGALADQQEGRSLRGKKKRHVAPADLPPSTGEIWTKPPLVRVAQDGSEQFRTIMEGLGAMPRKNKEYVVMYIKEGVYNEHVEVDRTLNMLVLVGDGPTKTRITGNLNVQMGGKMSTSRTATFTVMADDFMAKDIGFENTAGPQGHQAVAYRAQSDRSVLFNCHFDGYQDTLYAHTKRQFYRDCQISGTVDFIFGDAFAVFQNCRMVVRLPMENQQNIVTAHGSKEQISKTNYILHNCTITADPLLVPNIQRNPSYLGRPWKPYARTVYLQSDIDAVIHPDGWLEWAGEPASSDTCFYAEIDNRGAGSNKDNRVKWQGVKELGLDQAEGFTVEKFFEDPAWPMSTGVPVIKSLIPSGGQ